MIYAILALSLQAGGLSSLTFDFAVSTRTLALILSMATQVITNATALVIYKNY
jgi:hypothetical protein